MTLLSSRDLATKNTVSKMFSQENPDSGMRVLVGEIGQEEMHGVRETDDKDGE